FIGASGLPKTDLVGSSDPYFVAKIDDRISYVSTVQINTLKPVWNEIWKVKNVPAHADLVVDILDKDNGAPHDDFIGKFKTSVAAGAKEVEIEGPFLGIRSRGTFWIKIDSTPSAPGAQDKPYMFDGPIRYSTHMSPTIGMLTQINDARLYATWKMYIVGVPLYFGDNYQHWNVNYKAAQSIFEGPIFMRTGIQAGHRMLYARSTRNSFGVIESKEEFMKILQDDILRASRVKPAVYTYIISAEDDSFRFSETGATFFVDFASKHALHANCATTVRYSGEFHPRPKGGWAGFSENTPDDAVEWELVIDNNSGTYSPNKALLPMLQALMQANFPWVTVVAFDHEDPALKESREACRTYALKYRGVKQEELQPHAGEGEETLSHQAVVHQQAHRDGIPPVEEPESYI
ncbi:hypothetical protein FISHEDRAFT_43472, partial [Fistulina hepatica ATCC 64428]